MSMYFSTNMYNLKQFYWFKQKNLTHLDYENNCFNNDEYDFKVKIAVGI